MPLRKLWNTICGSSRKPTADDSLREQSRAGEPLADKSRPRFAPASSGHSVVHPPAKKSATAVLNDAVSNDAVSNRVVSKPIIKLDAISREDKKLINRIASLSPASVLEVGVGDGLRARHVAQALAKNGSRNPHSDASEPANYLAIDEFEMGGNPLTLRTFHQQLRTHAVKAQLVPMPIDAGLDRVVRTFGQVDVVIWSADTPPTPAQQGCLNRICKPNTVVFTREQTRWKETHHAATVNTRNAA